MTYANGIPLNYGRIIPNQKNRELYVNTQIPTGRTRLFSITGHVRLTLFSESDNGNGYVRFSMILDGQQEALFSPYPWVIASILAGIQSSNFFSGQPTGFPASANIVGRGTYITANFQTNSSGDVTTESIALDDPNIEAVGEISVYAINMNSSSVNIASALVVTNVD